MDQCLLDYWLPLRIEHWCDLGEESLLTLDMSKAAQLYQVSPHVIAPRTRKSKQGITVILNQLYTPLIPP